MNTKIRLAFCSLALSVQSLTLPSARADDTPAVKEVANGTTLVIAKVKTGQLGLPKVIREAPVPVRQAAEKSLNDIKKMLSSSDMYFAADLPTSAAFNARVLAPEKAVDWEGFTALLKQSLRLDLSKNTEGKWGVLNIHGGRPQAANAGSKMQADHKAWIESLEGMQEFPIQVAIRLPGYFRSTIIELDPDLPEVIGGGSAAELVKAFEAAHLAIDPQTSTGRLVIKTTSEAEAEKLSKRIPKMLASLAAQMGPEMESSRMLVLGALGILRPDVKGTNLVVSFEDQQEAESMLQIFAQAIQMAMKPIANNQSSNNLKQLALAFHNYQSAYQSFPPIKKYRDENGKSGLSWRVHVLPFLEQNELYQKFKLDEPWDSEHNIKLLSEMPEVFKMPVPLGGKDPVKPNHTVYVGPVGEDTLWGSKKQLGFRDILDGTSNTIMYVQLAPEHAVPWTAPQEYEVDKEDPSAKISNEDGYTFIAMMDGSVQRVKTSMAKKVWNAMFTINGGEVVQIEE